MKQVAHKKREIAKHMKGTKPFFAETMKDMGGNNGSANAADKFHPKMMDAIHKAEVSFKKKKYARVLNDFNRNARKRTEDHIWNYARLNPYSDKRIF